MVKGLYTAGTGMINEQRRVDVLSNNMANSSTTGFKKEGTTSEAFSIPGLRPKNTIGTPLSAVCWNISLLAEPWHGAIISPSTRALSIAWMFFASCAES